jgi:hypothetical protein
MDNGAMQVSPNPVRSRHTEGHMMQSPVLRYDLREGDWLGTITRPRNAVTAQPPFLWTSVSTIGKHTEDIHEDSIRRALCSRLATN